MELAIIFIFVIICILLSFILYYTLYRIKSEYKIEVYDIKMKNEQLEKDYAKLKAYAVDLETKLKSFINVKEDKEENSKVTYTTPFDVVDAVLKGELNESDIENRL